MFLWIYRAMHNTDFFIVNGADLKYTNFIFNFMVNSAVMEYIW